MTDELTLDETEQYRPVRDEDGDLKPVAREITWDGKPRTVKVIPVTMGHLSEYRSLQEGDFDDFDLKAVQVMLENHYRTPDFRNDDGEVPMEVVEDTPPERLIDLMDAFDLPDTPEAAGSGSQGNP